MCAISKNDYYEDRGEYMILAVDSRNLEYWWRVVSYDEDVVGLCKRYRQGYVKMESDRRVFVEEVKKRTVYLLLYQRLPSELDGT